jgi:hypothetical protein
VRAIHRHEVPVDDQWHTLALTGDVLHVATRNSHIVEIWTSHGDKTAERSFRVFATGQPLPDELNYIGTAIAPGGHLVWHLMEHTRER